MPVAAALLAQPTSLLERAAFGVAAVCLIFSPNAAHAAPQANVGLVAAGCSLGPSQDPLTGLAFCGALRADLLLGRQRDRSWGAGPYLSLGTAAFDDLRSAGGVTVLMPVTEDFPLVLAVGALLRDGRDWGVDASAFWGLRSFNFHSAYNLAGGLFVGAQRTFRERSHLAVSVGLQLDAFVLAVPFLLAWGALQ